MVGTDSHTTMIDGLGVAGWGVGGIEAGHNASPGIFSLLPLFSFVFSWLESGCFITVKVGGCCHFHLCKMQV